MNVYNPFLNFDRAWTRQRRIAKYYIKDGLCKKKPLFYLFKGFASFLYIFSITYPKMLLDGYKGFLFALKRALSQLYVNLNIFFLKSDHRQPYCLGLKLDNPECEICMFRSDCYGKL